MLRSRSDKATSATNGKHSQPHEEAPDLGGFDDKNPNEKNVTVLQSTIKYTRTMSVLGAAFEIVIWILLRIFALFTVPAMCARPFQQKKQVPPIEDNILFMSAEKLAESIRNQQISCEKVISTYINRIRTINPLLNAVIHDRFNLALDEAKAVDKLVQTNQSTEDLRVKYPLLGVPLTVKGSLSVKGIVNTSGMVGRNEIEDTDADIVALARKAGAIPLLTSNVPELCMNWETVNKVIGRTKNPYDTRRTCGGSSGGEAALIASGGSLIGLGSDLCGSLRLPPSFCGVYGLKPTASSVSIKGHYPNCSEDKWKDIFIVGPLARYASDLKLLFNIIVDENKKDLLKDPVPLNQVKAFYMEQINTFLIDKTNNNVLTAIHDVVDVLDEVLSRKCEKIKIEGFKNICGLTNIPLALVPNIEEVPGERPFFELFKYIFGCSKKMPSTLLGCLFSYCSWMIPKSMVKATYQAVDDLKSELTSLLGDNGIIIMPIHPTEAFYHGDSFKNTMNFSIMSIFNTLGFPAISCPVRIADNGLPVGVQIAAAPHCDNLLLSVAEEIEKRLGGWRPPSTIRNGTI